MPLNWIGAFKRALVYFLWLIVWGIIGILMMVIGAYVATVPLTNLFAGKTPAVGTELITGIVLLILGYIITMLGAVATLIRLVYQLSFEATQEAMTKGKPTGTAPSLAMPMAEIKLTPTAVQPVVQQPSPETLRQPMASTVPPAQQKYCAFCGRAVAISARFCPFCQRAQP